MAKKPLFIGRHKELESLNWLLGKRSASLVVVKGRRRVGKSRLITEFGKQHTFFSFTGLPPSQETTKESQLKYFSRALAKAFNMPGILFEEWEDAFSFLAERTKKGRVVILLDEISWMGSKDPDFSGKIKTAWDLHFKKNPELILIICGSVSSWIDKHIVYHTGFVGRISRTYHLKELSLIECDSFWGKYRGRTSAFEKFKILSVTGGIPRYLEEIRPELSAEENIKQLCFNPDGLLFNEFENIFSNTLLTRTDAYQRLIEQLIKGRMEPKKLCEAIGEKLNQRLTNYLLELVNAGFIARDYTWHLKSGKLSKLSHYRLQDNYLRFYLKYIYPRRAQIEKGAYQDISLSQLPGWSSMMGFQFENLVINNRQALLRLLHIPPEEVLYDNPFFQRRTATRAGCQIDYLIHTRFNILYVCEVKFTKREIKADVINEVQAKIEKMKLPQSFSYRPVLIHVNGVSEDVEESEFFSHIVSFEQLLST